MASQVNEEKDQRRINNLSNENHTIKVRGVFLLLQKSNDSRICMFCFFFLLLKICGCVLESEADGGKWMGQMH